MGKTFIHRADFTAGWCVMMALGVLLLPLRLLFAVVLATAFHELGHIVALKLQRIPIHSIIFHFGGASIAAGIMMPREECMAAAAGPAASFLLLCTVRLYPELALCGFCQGIFNLLPVYPLDGGRICAVFSRIPDRLRAIMESVSFFSVLGWGIWGAFLFPRWIPCILGLTVGILLRLRGNIACKDTVLAVQ